MTNRKHTPGPWRVELHNKGTERGIESGPNWIATVHRLLGDPDDITAELNANAALVAAAPELLEACKYIAEAFQEAGTKKLKLGRDGDHFKALMSAIAKAEGRANG